MLYKNQKKPKTKLKKSEMFQTQKNGCAIKENKNLFDIIF